MDFSVKSLLSDVGGLKDIMETEMAERKANEARRVAKLVVQKVSSLVEHIRACRAAEKGSKKQLKKLSEAVEAYDAGNTEALVGFGIR